MNRIELREKIRDTILGPEDASSEEITEAGRKADAIIALPEMQDILEDAMIMRVNRNAGGGLRP